MSHFWRTYYSGACVSWNLLFILSLAKAFICDLAAFLITDSNHELRHVSLSIFPFVSVHEITRLTHRRIFMKIYTGDFYWTCRQNSNFVKTDNRQFTATSVHVRVWYLWCSVCVCVCVCVCGANWRQRRIERCKNASEDRVLSELPDEAEETVILCLWFRAS